MGREEFARFMKEDTERWRAVIGKDRITIAD